MVTSSSDPNRLPTRPHRSAHSRQRGPPLRRTSRIVIITTRQLRTSTSSTISTQSPRRSSTQPLVSTPPPAAVSSDAAPPSASPVPSPPALRPSRLVYRQPSFTLHRSFSARRLPIRDFPRRIRLRPDNRPSPIAQWTAAQRRGSTASASAGIVLPALVMVRERLLLRQQHGRR